MLGPIRCPGAEGPGSGFGGRGPAPTAVRAEPRVKLGAADARSAFRVRPRLTGGRWTGASEASDQNKLGSILGEYGFVSTLV